MTATFHEQQAEMTKRVIEEAKDVLRIEARLAEQVSHAIERAPAVTAWWTGRLAMGRVA